MEAFGNTTADSTHVPQLHAVASARLALTWQQFVVVCSFVLLYLLSTYLPLFHAVTWRHIQSGEWIVANQGIPRVSPVLPLADGFEAGTTSWLSDVIFSQIWRRTGVIGISSAVAVAFTTLMVLTFAVFYVRTGRKRLALAGVAVALAVHWPRMMILRPEILGLICFGLLLLLISTHGESEDGRHRRMWLFCPPLILVWANLDGSVLLGVIVLAGLALARFIDAIRETRSIWLAVRDRRFHSAVYIAEVAAVVSMFQPAGFRLWTDLLLNTHASAWWEFGGYSPLVLATSTGWCVLGIWALTAVLLRLSQRSIMASEVAMMVMASLTVIVNRQMATWFVPMAIWSLLPHLADVLERKWFAPKFQRPAFKVGEPVPPLAFAFSMLSLLVIWCGFALSPLSNPLLGGRTRPTQRIVAKSTPVALSQFFQKSPTLPAGLVWVPEDWGDWISLTVPGLKISANSQIHLLTDRQKQDILQVGRGEGTWTRILDRYGVELLVVDKQRQTRLAESAMTLGTDWSIHYEDAQALVLKRKA